MHVRFARRARVTAVLAGLALLAGLVVVAPQIATAAAPPNPSNGQISAAAAHKNALSNKVGELSAQVAAMQSQLQQLQASKELAEQKFVYALSKLSDAKAAATAARAEVKTAQAHVAQAQSALQSYAEAAYMGGDVGGTTGSLLTAKDPNALLDAAALQGYTADHQISAISQMQEATVAKSNADAAARLAVQTQTSAEKAAAQAKKAADAALIAAQAQQVQLQQTLAANQTQLQAAQSELASLNHQKAAYNAYVAEQKRLAAARAAAQRRREEAARKAAERARQHHGSGGSTVGGGGSGSSGPPSGGSWTAQRGRAAVAKAKQYLGWMYAWAGGNRAGPTYGVCAGDGAENDCHVIGFDCSGLSLYAWGAYMNLDHYAATQYWEAGSYHPSTSNLMPGDLVFWSSNGSQSGIHHVAIYEGNGYVIQAPQSGEVIQETPLDQVDWGYFGATRPLT